MTVRVTNYFHLTITFFFHDKSVKFFSDLLNLCRVLSWPGWDTVCPRSSGILYVVTYHIKWVTTSWTHSTINFFVQELSVAERRDPDGGAAQSQEAGGRSAQVELLEISRNSFWSFPPPPLLRFLFFPRQISLRKFFEFIAQKDALLRPFPPFLM